MRADAAAARLAGRAASLLRTASGVAAAALLAAVVLTALAQVFHRYVLNASLVWSEELIRLLFVWMILLAAAGSAHMRVTLLDAALPAAMQRALRVVLALGSLALLGVVLAGAWRLLAAFGADGYVTLPVTRAWYWAAPIVAAALWSAIAVLSAIAGETPEGRPS